MGSYLISGYRWCPLQKYVCDINNNNCTDLESMGSVHKLWPHWEDLTKNDPLFISKEFKGFIWKLCTTTPHPMELWNTSIRQSSMNALCSSEKDGRTLSHHFTDILLKYLSTPHATTNETSSSLFLQHEICTHFSLIHPYSGWNISDKQANQLHSTTMTVGLKLVKPWRLTISALLAPSKSLESSSNRWIIVIHCLK